MLIHFYILNDSTWAHGKLKSFWPKAVRCYLTVWRVTRAWSLLLRSTLVKDLSFKASTCLHGFKNPEGRDHFTEYTDYRHQGREGPFWIVKISLGLTFTKRDRQEKALVIPDKRDWLFCFEMLKVPLPNSWRYKVPMRKRTADTFNKILSLAFINSTQIKWQPSGNF